MDEPSEGLAPAIRVVRTLIALKRDGQTIVAEQNVTWRWTSPTASQ